MIAKHTRRAPRAGKSKTTPYAAVIYRQLHCSEYFTGNHIVFNILPENGGGGYSRPFRPFTPSAPVASSLQTVVAARQAVSYSRASVRSHAATSDATFSGCS